VALRESQAADSERADRPTLAARQADTLGRLLRIVYRSSPFYAHKLDVAGIRVERLTLPDGLDTLPFTTKAELVADQEANPPWGSVIT